MEIPKVLLYCDAILKHLSELPNGEYSNEEKLSQALNIPRSEFDNIIAFMRTRGFILFTASHGMCDFHLKPSGRAFIATQTLEKEWVRDNTPNHTVDMSNNSGNIFNQSSVSSSQIKNQNAPTKQATSTATKTLRAIFVAAVGGVLAWWIIEKLSG